MSKTLNNYIATLEYADNNMLVLLGAISSSSLFSFTSVLGKPFGTVSISQVLLLTD